MKIAKASFQYHFNCRPVSSLPQFSKILEKLSHNRRDAFLEKYKILAENQYGFRSNRSTSLAITEAIEKHHKCQRLQEICCRGIYWFKKKKAFDIAFDNKRARYWIRGIVLDWVKSYLNGRQQFVKLGDCASSCLDSACGQCWVLNPLFCTEIIYRKCQSYCTLYYLWMTQIFFALGITYKNNRRTSLQKGTN